MSSAGGTPTASLDRLAPGDAFEHLLACCGARRWAEEMVARRPFGTFEQLARGADEVWGHMGRDDVLEAFAAHPDLGDRRVAKTPPTSRSAGWSRQEQALAGRSDTEILEALAQGNRRHVERFGHRFILCATGRTGEEILAELERRIENTPEAELAEAGAEQLAITHLRLAKLIAALDGPTARSSEPTNP